MSASTPVRNPLFTLIELSHRARHAAGPDELAFLLVNDTHSLLPYRQAALWLQDQGIRTLSGVIQPEAHGPYVQWLLAVCQELATQDRRAGLGMRSFQADDLSPATAAAWADWFPPHALWLPLPQVPDLPGGGLLLVDGAPFSPDLQPLAQEWIENWHQAWRLMHPPTALSLAQRWTRLRQAALGSGWWRQRPLQIGLGLLALLCLPVRLSVLAPGELVPAHPRVVRAPLDGVIGEFHVRPNEPVKAGQTLFSFDEAPIRSRLEVARQEQATAEAEYRQMSQLALNDSKSRTQLAAVLGKINEKRAEADFLQEQFNRAQVSAPQAGVALFDDPTEWIGRPVQTGERIMRIASPEDMEIEAWLPVGDAIPLPEDAQVRLYLSASPFHALAGSIRYVSHDASPRPDGSYAYRVRAKLDDPDGQRIGLKGTAKLSGEWVTLGYWMFRRPLALIRQFVAL
jgi:hypothetical protein